MRRARLAEIDLPDFGLPTTEPTLGRAIHDARLSRLRSRMAEARYDAVVIYGDREHMANICWLTGYDPRFEEAICVVTPNRAPVLLVGNEGMAYVQAAAAGIEPVLWQPLSLMSQPRDRYRPLAGLLRDAGLRDDMSIGVAGWKGFETEDGVFDPQWFETPNYLVEELRDFGMVENAALLFMHPEHGLRAINEIDELARFEYAATLTSSALLRAIRAARPGMSEHDIVRAMGLNGLPWSMHLIACSGLRARFGLASPSSRIVERGDAIAIAHGLVGALNCRAGFLAAGVQDLPAHISDYVEKLVAPYFEAAAAWYETLTIGITGGALYDAVMSRIGDSFFGIGLNPGHLIHYDEWLHSPVRKGSRMRLASGMALQCDIIPATGTDYFSSNIEDGVALLDAEGRSRFAARYPEAWARIEARRAFMRDALGINLHPEVLPFSSMPAWLPPFWLSPHRAMTLT